MASQIASRISNLSTDELKTRINQIAHDAKLASSQLRELVFSINPDFDHFEDMQAYFQEHARNYLEDSKIKLSFDLPKAKINDSLHPDIKRQLLLIFKELLNNIIKHSEAKQVWISLRELSNREYQLELKDDGIGFDPNQDRKASNGLRGMIRRAESIGAHLRIHSELNKGSVFSLTGPFKID